MLNQTFAHLSSSAIQMKHVKNGAINTGFLSQRDVSAVAERSLTDQRAALDSPGSSHIVRNPPTNPFTARNTATLFSETVTVKQPFEQQESAFRRQLSGQDNIGFNQSKFSSQNLLNSQASHKLMQTELINGYQKQSSNVIIPRPSTLSDSYSCMYKNNMKSSLFLLFSLF
jgi:hypothetical protein